MSVGLGQLGWVWASARPVVALRTEMCTRVVVESLVVPQAHGPGLVPGKGLQQML